MKRYMALFIIFCAVLPLNADGGILLPNGPNVAVTVSPPQGALYYNTHLFKEWNLNNFTYYIEFLDDENKGQKTVWLQFFNIESKSWSEPPEIVIFSENENNKSIELNLSKILGEYLGDVRFRIFSDNASPDSSTLVDSLGPRILANFKNESWEKNSEDSYTYSVDVRASNGANDITDIYLYYYDQVNGNWTRMSEIQTYRDMMANWIRISWVDAPFYQMIEFGLNSLK